MNTWTIQRIGSRTAGATLGIAMVFALMLTTARQAGAQEQVLDASYEDCTDAAWAEYNRCLMTSESRLRRILCDLDWEANMTNCVSAEIEQITN